MEYYIEYKGVLYNSYEWAGGYKVNPKVTKERYKLVKKGQAKIVDETFFDSKNKKKVSRK